MKKTTAYLLGVFFALSLPMQTLIGQDQAEQDPEQNTTVTYSENLLIITYRDGVSDEQKTGFRAEFSATLVETYPYIKGELWSVSPPINHIDPETGIEEVLNTIFEIQDKSNKKPELNSDVDFSNTISNSNTTTTPPPSINSYNPIPLCNNISAKAPTGSKSVLVGFIDTGIEPQFHTSVFSDYFDMSTSPYKYNAINPGQDPIDTHGHGTRMAGATCGIAASLGYSDMDLWVAKVFDNNGTAWLSDIIWAIDNARKDNVHILNLSASQPGIANNIYPQTFEDALDEYITGGGLPICSAGNDGNVISSLNPVFPASLNNLPGLLVVGASDCDSGLTSWSNFSSTYVDVAAPGKQITVPSLSGSWVTTDGTSIAAALATSVAVITASNDIASNGFNNDKVLCSIINSVTPDTDLTGDVASGGYVNAAGARQYVLGNTCVPPGSLSAPDHSFDIGIESSNFGLTVYPNPFSDNFQLVVNSEKPANATIRLFNGQGQLILQKSAHFAGGENQIQMNDPELKEHTGLLLLQIDGAGKREHIRLIRH